MVCRNNNFVARYLPSVLTSKDSYDPLTEYLKEINLIFLTIGLVLYKCKFSLLLLPIFRSNNCKSIDYIYNYDQAASLCVFLFNHLTTQLHNLHIGS